MSPFSHGTVLLNPNVCERTMRCLKREKTLSKNCLANSDKTFYFMVFNHVFTCVPSFPDHNISIFPDSVVLSWQRCSCWVLPWFGSPPTHTHTSYPGFKYKIIVASPKSIQKMLLNSDIFDLSLWSYPPGGIRV